MRKTIWIALLLIGCAGEDSTEPQPCPTPGAGGGGGEGGAGGEGGGPVGLAHDDGLCFALAPGVYPTSYQWCAQEFPEFPVPFACVETPPAASCVPLAGEPSADRFCCCDPQATAGCDFYTK